MNLFSGEPAADPSTMQSDEVTRIRIVFLIRSLFYGGAERQLLTLVRGLDKSRFEPVVVCFYSGGDLEPDFLSAGIRVISLQKNGRWDIAGFFFRLIDTVRALKPDILHSYLTMSNVLAGMIRWLGGGPLVIFGIRYAFIDFSHYDWTTRFIYWLETRLSKFASLTITNSNASKTNHIIKGYEKDRIIVIPNGIDTDAFFPSPQERQEFRARLGVEPGVKLVGLVGRLDPVKGHPTFLKAATQLLKEREDVRFLCVGDGDERYQNELKNLAKSLGIAEKIIWLEGQKNVRAVYNGLDINCSASIGESFSNVIAEAMACGLPCVVTDAGDSAVIVGEYGVVEPIGNAEELARGLNRVLDLPGEERRALGENCRKRIKEEFSVERMVRRTEEVMINLAKGKTTA